MMKCEVLYRGRWLRGVAKWYAKGRYVVTFDKPLVLRWPSFSGEVLAVLREKADIHFLPKAKGGEV